MSFDLKMIRGLLVKIIRLENKNPLLREQGMLNEEPKKGGMITILLEGV